MSVLSNVAIVASQIDVAVLCSLVNPRSMNYAVVAIKMRKACVGLAIARKNNVATFMRWRESLKVKFRGQG